MSGSDPAGETEGLPGIHADIEARVGIIRGAHPEWPCSRGCASCCRRLGEVPSLAAAEWRLLQEGLVTLPPERLRQIGGDMARLSAQASRPVTCPMLDTDTDACLVYAWRPVACRTYGFYVQRDLGFYCRDIESRVEGGGLLDVVWGNQDAIETRLARQGEIRLLTDWFDDWMKGRLEGP